jgi:hypothetical protein
MMRRRLLIALAFGFAAATAMAGNSKVGTSGAQFLKIGAGARPTAMGDAYTAVSDDVNAVHFNPAGLSQLDRAQITALHTQWFQGLDYNFGAFAVPTAAGTFGLSASTLKAGDLDRRGADESSQGTFSDLDSAYGLSYGRGIGETWSVGASARLVRQQIADARASAWGGDVGVLKRFADSRYSLGLAARNFGQSVKFHGEGDPLPFVVDAGGAGRFINNHLLLALRLSAPRDNDLQYGAGVEWAQGRPEGFRYAARAGYQSINTDPNGATGVSLGGGIGFRRLDLDFAWAPFGDLGNTFRYAVLFRF